MLRVWWCVAQVGCTCLSVGHPMLAGRVFDVCIMDEAGQVTLPAVLGALGLARSFCLVGDHHQLPPLVQSPRAAEGGLSCSLFRRLCEAHPEVRPPLGLENHLESLGLQVPSPAPFTVHPWPSFEDREGSDVT